MKRIALFLICVVGTLCTMCDPPFPPEYEGRWYVKNRTDQTLVLTYPFLKHSVIDYVSYNRSIAPGDSLLINNSCFLIKNKIKPSFDRCLEDAVSEYGENLSLKVLSEYGVLQIEWLYLNRNHPGKQFFDEPFWHHYDVSIQYDERVTTTDIWVFDITPEDITQTKQQV